MKELPKFDIKRIDFLFMSDVRAFCIERGLYTCGCNGEYEEMLCMCREASEKEGVITTVELVAIARNIYYHSQITGDETEFFLDLLTGLANLVHRTYERVEDE